LLTLIRKYTMQGNTEKSARLVALEVLDSFKMSSANAAEILNQRITQTPHRARATDIVYGVIRNMAAVDLVIEKVGEKPPKRIAKRLQGSCKEDGEIVESL
jgi:hypothetical protein